MRCRSVSRNMKPANHCGERVSRILAEKVGFEPTYRLPDKLISSQSRYGHFGTSPCHKICKLICMFIQFLFHRTAFRESHLRPLGQPSRLCVHPKCLGNWGEQARYSVLKHCHKISGQACYGGHSGIIAEVMFRRQRFDLRRDRSDRPDLDKRKSKNVDVKWMLSGVKGRPMTPLPSLRRMASATCRRGTAGSVGSNRLGLGICAKG